MKPHYRLTTSVLRFNTLVLLLLNLEFSFEQTASFLGILADNGFTASRAGTGLRNVLLESAKSGKTFSEFLEELSKRNLDVSRATDLFGKRGAAAAIVLANNTEKVKSLSEELEKVGQVVF